MRWPATPKPQEGDIRTIRKFLIFPKCIKNQWRWLEKAKIYQKYESFATADNGIVWQFCKWEDKEWRN